MKTRQRVTQIIFVIFGVIACLGLAYWQWERFKSVGGTGQNLGYALQWPAFAVCLVYMYRKFVYLETRTDDEAQVEAEKIEKITSLSTNLLPEKKINYDINQLPDVDDNEDEEIELERLSYNKYLASLDNTPTKISGKS